MSRVTEKASITNCEVCADIADKGFEAGPTDMSKVASTFLAHVVEEHPTELLELLAREYLPVFMAKRSMR
ncbi:MAG TPA: hypothetical protein VEJ36_07150 [Nitrososphaerales archaeon]|nr:hypothetical protein [Nitrososphaerales archaeon]